MRFKNVNNSQWSIQKLATWHEYLHWERIMTNLFFVIIFSIPCNLSSIFLDLLSQFDPLYNSKNICNYWLNQIKLNFQLQGILPKINKTNSIIYPPSFTLRAQTYETQKIIYLTHVLICNLFTSPYIRKFYLLVCY
jgi:hypothetical protein